MKVLLASLLLVAEVSGFTASSRRLVVKPSSASLKMGYLDDLQAQSYIVTPLPAPVGGTVDPSSAAALTRAEISAAADRIAAERILAASEKIAAQMLDSSRSQAIAAAAQPPAPVVAQAESGSSSINGLIAAGIAVIAAPLWIFLASTLNTPAPTEFQLSTSIPGSVTTSKTTNAKPAGVVVLSQPITKQEVRKLFDLWNDALKTGDPDIVAKRYSKEGVLLPTLSDVPRNDFAGIRDYFVHFCEKKPVGKILEGEIYVGNNWAQDAGIYEFTFGDGSSVKARYSFIYVYEDGAWKISHHHSSLMPEEVVRPVAVSKEEVRVFFNLWNDALKTLDPQKVTDRYTTDAVLLPTLSDKARYTNDEIKDYFVHFCEKKPVGTITEGNVKIGANWAQDAGLYQFSFADGSVAKGRYSFIYVYENGEWKISHHHSSLLPEPAVAAMNKLKAMEIEEVKI